MQRFSHHIKSPLLTISILTSLLSSIASFAAGSIAGHTANGCNYSVINGKYLYDCTKTAAAAPSPTLTPPSSYSNIPLVKGTNSPSSPATANSQPTIKTIEAPKSASSAAAKTDDPEEAKSFISQSYFGFLAGSTTISASGAGKSTGIGFTLGSNLDDYLGLEIGYSYTTQDLNLDLASRQSNPGSTVLANDSSLNAHLLVAELQFHATNLSYQFRPFLSAGLGWKHSNLEDPGQAGFSGNPSIPGSSITQSTFGPSTAIGTKFRFSENFQGILDFRYFLPIVKTQASVSQSSDVGAGRLSAADAPLTNSSLYQLQLGILYLF